MTLRSKFIACLSLAAVLGASAGCGDDKVTPTSGTSEAGGKSSGQPSVAGKAKQIAVIVGKKLWKYNPVGVIIEIVDAVIKIRAIIDGKHVVYELEPLTADQLEQAKKDGELTVRDADGTEHKVKVQDNKHAEPGAAADGGGR